MKHKGKREQTVLHIAPTPFFADRGCHIRIRNEVEALAPHPFKIVVCTYHLGRDVKGIDTRRALRVPGYDKLDAGYSPFRFIADFFLFFLVLKTVWQEKPGLLHCHLHEGVCIGWVVKWCLFWRRLPIVMDMQGSLSGELTAYNTLSDQSFLLRVVKKIEGLICRMPDFFLCSSTRSRSCLVNDFKVFPEKTAVLQDIVPDTVFQTAAAGTEQRQQQGIPPESRVVLYTGSLLPGKGVQNVLEVMKRLCADHEDFFFILVGYPLEAATEFLRVHHLESRCLLPGQVDYADLPGWLALGDVAVEPKEDDSGEASGKLLHYMAAGLPVVCFETENNSRILGSSGYFVPVGDVMALAEAVAAVLADPEQARRKGEQGRERVRVRYSSTAVGKELTRIYSRFSFHA